MKYVLVESGRIVETWPQRPNLHPALMAAVFEVPISAEIGWTYEGGIVAPPPPPPLPPINLAKSQKWAEIAAAYDRRLDEGLAYGGKVLQIREKDQPNITTVGNEARWAKLAGAGWPANFGWRMLDNTYLALPTPDSMIALGEAAKAEVLRIRQVKWGHFDAVGAMTDPAAILAYDYSVGW